MESWCGLALLGALATGLACRGPGAGQAGAPAAPRMTVVTARVERKTIPIYSEYVGQTGASSTVELRARVEGFLQQVYFKEGATVKKGERLFQIDPQPFAAALQSAQAQLAKAESQLAFARQRVGVLKAQAQLDASQAEHLRAAKDVTRYRPLAADDIIPQQELDAALTDEQATRANVDAAKATLKNAELTEEWSIRQAAADVQAAQANVTKAKLDLGYTSITAPITGVIGRLNVDVGNLVGRGEPTLLATLSATDPMYVTFSIGELDYLHLASRIRDRAAQPPTFELLLANGAIYPHPGRFSMAERGLDPQTGTLPVRAEFDNPDGLLKPGLFIRIRVQTDRLPDAVLVPQRAVAEIQSAQTVMVVDAAGKAALRTITTGARYENDWVVRSGLSGGEQVIVEGRQKVRPGMRVAPQAAAPQAAPAAKAKGR